MERNFSSLRLAIAGAVLLIGPTPAWPRSVDSPSTTHDWTLGDRDVKPACVYKGAMSDAEIERCTGHPVHYDYNIRSRGAAAPPGIPKGARPGAGGIRPSPSA